MFNNKFKLFSISLLAVWFVLFVRNVDIPVYWGHDYSFVGWERVLTLGNLIAFLSLIMIVVAVLSLVQLRHRLKGSPDSLPVSLSEVHDKNYDYINTLATLVTLFSIILVPVESFRDFIIFVVLMTVICVCFLKTNLYYSNPIFAALGYRLYSVKATTNLELPENTIAIYHGKLEPGQMIQYYHVADNVYYLK